MHGFLTLLQIFGVIMAMELRNYTEDFVEASTNGWHDILLSYSKENLSNKGEKMPGRRSFSINFLLYLSNFLYWVPLRFILFLFYLLQRVKSLKIMAIFLLINKQKNVSHLNLQKISLLHYKCLELAYKHTKRFVYCLNIKVTILKLFLKNVKITDHYL